MEFCPACSSECTRILWIFDEGSVRMECFQCNHQWTMGTEALYDAIEDQLVQLKSALESCAGDEAYKRCEDEFARLASMLKFIYSKKMTSC